MNCDTRGSRRTRVSDPRCGSVPALAHASFGKRRAGHACNDGRATWSAALVFCFLLVAPWQVALAKQRDSDEGVAVMQAILELRQNLENSPDDAASQAELTRTLASLHALPYYQRRGNLTPSRHAYSTTRLVGDQPIITGYQQGMLLHGRPVQFLDPPSMQLPSYSRKPGWAAYNPSVLPIQWLGQAGFLLTFRVSTWNLCTWDGQRSPLQQLPVVKGKQTVTSKVSAMIVNENFEAILPMRGIEGLAHKEHYCNHHTGMRRVGADDGRLFSLGGKPWLLFAAVALRGERAYCFHHLMLCPLSLPDSDTGRVRCLRKTQLRFDRADKISEKARAAGNLPNVHQKNWSPIVVHGQLFVVFTIEPFVVLRVDHETGECIQVSETRASAMKVFHAAASRTDTTLGVHGGSPYVQLPEPHQREMLGIGRVARGNTQYVLFFHTLIALGGESPKHFAISRVSPLFCFASTSPAHAGLCETIQFAGGLTIDGGKIMVTYGTNDCEAKVAFLPLEQVLSMLLPASG